MVTAAGTRLLMLRHGESEWNAMGRWQGHADPALSELGRRQAVAAAGALGPFDAVWASDLRRAAMTAQVIVEVLGAGTVQLDVRLRETDVGPWEGLNLKQVERGWPGFLAAQRRPDGFEPYERAAQRVMDALQSIAAASPAGRVLIVSHGGVIRAVRRVLGADDRRLPNLCGCWFGVCGDGTMSAGDHVEMPALAS